MWIWLLTAWVVGSFPLAMLCGLGLRRFGHESVALSVADLRLLQPETVPA